jgi:hypothetical protein
VLHWLGTAAPPPPTPWSGRSEATSRWASWRSFSVREPERSADGDGARASLSDRRSGSADALDWRVVEAHQPEPERKRHVDKSCTDQPTHRGLLVRFYTPGITQPTPARSRRNCRLVIRRTTYGRWVAGAAGDRRGGLRVIPDARRRAPAIGSSSASCTSAVGPPVPIVSSVPGRKRGAGLIAEDPLPASTSHEPQTATSKTRSPAQARSSPGSHALQMPYICIPQCVGHAWASSHAPVGCASATFTQA